MPLAIVAKSASESALRSGLYWTAVSVVVSSVPAVFVAVTASRYPPPLENA
jgi:hypothetical protein